MRHRRGRNDDAAARRITALASGELGRLIKLRHAASFAILGWFLMIPPIGTDANGRMLANSKAPLSLWLSEGSVFVPPTGAASIKPMASALNGEFRFKAENWQAWADRDSCENRRNFLLREYQSLWQSDVAPTAEQIADSECVATDDPRLKSN